MTISKKIAANEISMRTLSFASIKPFNLAETFSANLIAPYMPSINAASVETWMINPFVKPLYIPHSRGMINMMSI